MTLPARNLIPHRHTQLLSMMTPIAFSLRFLLTTYIVFGLALGLAIGNPAFALESDKNQPISIQADQASLSESKGLAVYSGQVELSQGSIKMQCDTLTISSDKHGVNRVEALGKPARFEQMITKTDPILRAKAQKIIYLPTSNIVLLKTKAQVKQGANLFEGDLIEYNLKSQQLSASKNPAPPTTTQTNEEADGRVKMILQPRKPASGDTPSVGNGNAVSTPETDKQTSLP